PTPSSQAKLVPPWAVWPARLVITLDDDWLQGEVPLSKPPLVTTWAGVQAAAGGAADGAAAAGVMGRVTTANAAAVNALARALWGVGLTRNSFESAGIPACSVAARPTWVCRGAAAGCAHRLRDRWGEIPLRVPGVRTTAAESVTGLTRACQYAE